MHMAESRRELRSQNLKKLFLVLGRPHGCVCRLEWIALELDAR